MISWWPVAHTHKHLKREVLYNLIEEWEEYATKLQFHLDKQELCYRDAVIEIQKRDGDEDIPAALSDFILVTISLTTKIPIFVIYPTVDRTTDANNRPVMKFMPNINYLFCKDANKMKSRSPDLVVVVYNGIDYYAPTAPKEIAHITRNCMTASTHIEDAVGLIDKIVLNLPPSTAWDSLMKSLKFMRAANIQLEETSLTTGTAVSTGMPIEVPIPKLASTSSVAKLAHKRVAASLGQAPPEKRKGEIDDLFASPKKKYSETVSITAARDTKLGPFQCPCLLNFTSMQELLDHQENAHPDPNTWKCVHCPSVSNSKGHCWSHSHHHLNKWYHYCDCDYLNHKDKDENGQPKKKCCKKGFDELIGVEFHRETHHNVGKCSVHCDYCDKPQQSVRQKKTHHETCSSGPNKDGAPTRWCDQEGCGYSCRTAQSLNKHMATDHPAAIGLVVAKRWKCHLCGKEFKSPQGYKGHDCTTVKVHKPRKRRAPLPDIGG